MSADDPRGGAPATAIVTALMACLALVAIVAAVLLSPRCKAANTPSLILGEVFLAGCLDIAAKPKPKGPQSAHAE